MKLPIGCECLLLDCILCILILVFPGAMGRCKYTHRQCTDGSCIPVNSVTMRCPDECKLMETKCPDTSCVSLLNSCPNNCGSGYKQCRGGRCIPSYKKCPGECERMERECPDGSCTASYRGLCPGECGFNEKKCPDGTCISDSRRCPGECKHHEKWCPDGTCVSSTRGKCSGGRCPHSYPISCSSGTMCYHRSEKCDGKRHCPDGTDENTCRRGVTWLWLLFIPCVGVIALCILYYICCKYKKNRIARQPAIHAERMTRRGDYNDYGHGGRPGIYGHPRSLAASALPETDPEVNLQSYPEADPKAPPSYSSVMSSEKYREAPTAPTLPPQYAYTTEKTEF